MAEQCRICDGTRFTDQNYSDHRRIEVPEGVIHFGCLGHWLVRDGLERTLPDASDGEREVLELRLGYEPDASPTLVELKDVAKQQRWSSSTARASQLQSAAMAKFERNMRQARTRSETLSVSLSDEDAKHVVTEAERRGVEPEDLVHQALDRFLGSRRTLAFVALGDGREGFSAAESEAVLRTELGR